MGVFKVAESNFILKIRFELGLNYYEGKQSEASYWIYDSFPVIAGLKWRLGEDKGKKRDNKRKKIKDKKTINEDKRTKNEDGMRKSNTLCGSQHQVFNLCAGW